MRQRWERWDLRPEMDHICPVSSRSCHSHSHAATVATGAPSRQVFMQSLSNFRILNGQPYILCESIHLKSRERDPTEREQRNRRRWSCPVSSSGLVAQRCSLCENPWDCTLVTHALCCACIIPSKKCCAFISWNQKVLLYSKYIF